MSISVSKLLWHANAILRNYSELGFPPEESSDHATVLACFVKGLLHDERCVDHTTCTAMLRSRDTIICDQERQISELKKVVQ